MDNSATSKTSAGGVLFKKDKNQIKILLIKDAWNQWTFPKGFVEENEMYRETAIREISEELGINAKSLHYCSDLGEIEYDYIWKTEKIHKKVYYYLYEWVINQAFHLQKEEGIQKVKWVKVGDLKNAIGYKNENKAFLKKLDDKLKIKS